MVFSHFLYYCPWEKDFSPSTGTRIFFFLTLFSLVDMATMLMYKKKSKTIVMFMYSFYYKEVEVAKQPTEPTGTELQDNNV